MDRGGLRQRPPGAVRGRPVRARQRRSGVPGALPTGGQGVAGQARRLHRHREQDLRSVLRRPRSDMFTTQARSISFTAISSHPTTTRWPSGSASPTASSPTPRCRLPATRGRRAPSPPTTARKPSKPTTTRASAATAPAKRKTSWRTPKVASSSRPSRTPARSRPRKPDPASSRWRSTARAPRASRATTLDAYKAPSWGGDIQYFDTCRAELFINRQDDRWRVPQRARADPGLR